MQKQTAYGLSIAAASLTLSLALGASLVVAQTNSNFNANNNAGGTGTNYLYFTASKTRVLPGELVRLGWQSNAPGELSASGQYPFRGRKPPIGSEVVSLPKVPGNYTYTLTAVTSAGAVMRKSVTITVASLPSPIPPAPPVIQLFLRGDANRNGKVDISDLIRIADTLRRYRPPEDGKPELIAACPKAADANDDGVVNLDDVFYLLSYLFTGGRQPPAPYPTVGSDPTPDGLTCSNYPITL